MTARIIDGTAIAAKVREQVAREAKDLESATGVIPGLIVVLVGENPASQVYVRNKKKTCQEAGWYSDVINLPPESTQEQVAAELDRLNTDTRVHGILLQLPLPAHLNETDLLQRILPEKDVDGFHPVNAGKLSLGLKALVPCTPLGVQRMLVEENIETRGKLAVIIGRSNIVGKPMAQLLMRKGPGADATVCVCHSRSQNLADMVRQADIVIAAIGQSRFVKGDWIKPGATVIDVGMNRIQDPSTKSGTRLVGDVDFEEAKKIAGAITPVPGGVGPMTIAMLMHNALQCAREQAYK